MSVLRVAGRGNRNDWAMFGRFTMTTDSPGVLCGVCLESFRDPASKAKHLRAAHQARVQTVVDADGLMLYEWLRP